MHSINGESKAAVIPIQRRKERNQAYNIHRGLKKKKKKRSCFRFIIRNKIKLLDDLINKWEYIFNTQLNDDAYFRHAAVRSTAMWAAV